MTDRERGEALAPGIWQNVLKCGDHLDRFPCQGCGATSWSQCRVGLTREQNDAARDFINGYGWTAARKLAERPAPEAAKSWWKRLLTRPAQSSPSTTEQKP